MLSQHVVLVQVGQAVLVPASRAFSCSYRNDCLSDWRKLVARNACISFAGSIVAAQLTHDFIDGPVSPAVESRKDAAGSFPGSFFAGLAVGFRKYPLWRSPADCPQQKCAIILRHACTSTISLRPCHVKQLKCTARSPATACPRLLAKTSIACTACSIYFSFQISSSCMDGMKRKEQASLVPLMDDCTSSCQIHLGKQSASIRRSNQQ